MSEEEGGLEPTKDTTVHKLYAMCQKILGVKWVLFGTLVLLFSLKGHGRSTKRILSNSLV